MLSKLNRVRKFIIVTGGPYSGLGKGINASSIGKLLKARGVTVTALKIDGYKNIDAGTMSPFEHGEVYVTFDGGETDLDLGNYERFIGLELTRKHSLTMGKILMNVLTREREGGYLGKTVQDIPHVTDEIAAWIRDVADTPVKIDGETVQPEVCIVEIGGTVGDTETLNVFHSIKRMCAEPETNESFCFVHISPIVYVGSSDGDREPKTKPAQQSVSKLWELGIRPDILIMRCEKHEHLEKVRQKLHTQCFVPMEGVISCPDAKDIHYVPELLKQQNILGLVETKLGLSLSRVWNLDPYYNLLNYFDQTDLPEVQLAIVGKYTGMNDTYLSLIRAIEHGGFANNVRVNITWIDAENYELEILQNFHGVLVPGGFGTRGIDGMRKAVKLCKENKVPYFGICLGMQVMVCELYTLSKDWGYNPPSSAEWEEFGAGPKVINILPEQDQKLLGGTMRLGNYETTINDGSQVMGIYKSDKIIERHRHRYEVSKRHVDDLSQVMRFSGYHKETNLCEIVELPDHPFMIGCQFHPEYRSRYWEPHPLFVAFVKALILRSEM
jgi:CTP synthase